MLLKPHIIAKIDEIFENALKDGRTVLYEHEVYEMLSGIGQETPRHAVVRREEEVDEELIKQFHGRMVLKIISRDMAHKQKYGGVKVLHTQDPLYVRYVMSAMQKEIYSHFKDREKPRIDGFMLAEFVEFSQGLGFEVLFGGREDSSFGPILTVSKGGDDAEFFAKFYDPANLYISPLNREEAFESMSGIRIRHKFLQIGKLEYMDMMAETLLKISDLMQTYSLISGGKGKYRIKALDINPVVFTKDGRFMVVDGNADFAVVQEESLITAPDAKGLEGFFKPQGVAIIGVSAQADKFTMGRCIADLFLGMGREDVYFVNAKGGTTTIRGKEYPLYRNIAEIPQPVGLYVYTAPAKFMLDFISEVEADKCVVLISGIPTDVSNAEFHTMFDAHKKEGVRIVGPNCMGVFYSPSNKGEGVDTLFINSERMPIKWGERSNTALFSQSGAMCITCLDNLQNYGLFRAIVSYGNRWDVGIPELMAYFENEKDVDIMAIYMEGFGQGEGRQFFELAKASKKPIIVFKSGRTEAGALAAKSHTAAISGSYEVFQAACSQAGVVLIDEMDSFYNAMRTFSLLWKKRVRGNRVAAVVNAGFESTTGADNVGCLVPAEYSEETVAKLHAINKNGLANVPASFLDITPMADDELYEKYLTAIMEDEHVDCVFVAIIPHIENLMTSDDVCDQPDSLAARIIRVFNKYDKPMVLSVNAGRQFGKFVRLMEEAGIPVFKDIRSATRELERFVQYRLDKGQE